MQGIYTYIPETNCVRREYSVAAILLLLFMVLISSVSVLNLLYFYISTFRSILLLLLLLMGGRVGGWKIPKKEIVKFPMIIKIQPDATVCRYLITAKSRYMFRVSQHPSSVALKTVTAAWLDFYYYRITMHGNMSLKFVKFPYST